MGEKHAHPSKQEAELDMYADDFDVKEKAKLDETESNYCFHTVIIVFVLITYIT